MSELGRIYWSRKLLKLSYSVVVLWLAWSTAGVLINGSFISGQPASTGIAVATQIFESLAQQVLAAAAAPALILLALGITAGFITARDARRRDPLRRFTKQQRREGMARAGGQCELGVGAHRCSRAAEHGDHFYPWSKGGATSLQNFVAACSRCNRAKSAWIPSPTLQKRIERRRLAAGADASDLLVGERRS